MDEYQSGEETAFIVDEISGIIKESIEAAIGGNAYQPSRVSQWTTSVVELCLSQLTKLGKPFKYIESLQCGHRPFGLTSPTDFPKIIPPRPNSLFYYLHFTDAEGLSSSPNYNDSDLCNNAKEWCWFAHS